MNFASAVERIVAVHSQSHLLLHLSAAISKSHSLIRPGVELGRYAADWHYGWNLSEPEHNEEVLKQEAVLDATS